MLLDSSSADPTGGASSSSPLAVALDGPNVCPHRFRYVVQVGYRHRLHVLLIA